MMNTFTLMLDKFRCSASATSTFAIGALIVPLGNRVPAWRFVNTV